MLLRTSVNVFEECPPMNSLEKEEALVFRLSVVKALDDIGVGAPIEKVGFVLELLHRTSI